MEKTTLISDGRPLRVIADELGQSSDIFFRGLESRDPVVPGLAIAIPRFPGDQPPVFVTNVESAYY